MPHSIEEHITYTRNELTTFPYYIKVIDILKNNNITSYIDIGANSGEFCNTLFESIPTLETAYLIEPEEKNFNFLQNHVSKGKNIKCINSAIIYNFNYPKLINITGNVGGFQIQEIEDKTEGIIVDIKTLEELNLPTVDLIKMDVEGAEFNIIENSNYLHQIKWLEIEFHFSPGYNIRQYISENLSDYSLEVIEENFEGRYLLKHK